MRCALKLALKYGDRHGQAQSLSHLAEVACLQGRFDEAERRYRESLAAAEGADDRCFALLGLIEVAGRGRAIAPRPWRQWLDPLQQLVAGLNRRLPRHCRDRLARVAGDAPAFTAILDLARAGPVRAGPEQVGPEQVGPEQAGPAP